MLRSIISTKSKTEPLFSLCKESHRYFTLSALTLIVLSGQCEARSNFNPAFLENLGAESDVSDLSSFAAKSDNQMPGKYLVDIYLNGNPVDHREVEFVMAPAVLAQKDATGLIPCFTSEVLRNYGVKTDSMESAAASSAAPENAQTADKNASATPSSVSPEQCSNILQKIPAAKTTFDFEHQRLDISVPQIFVSNSARGYVDPALWDDGISALLLNYNFTGANGDDQNDYYLNLRSGFNLGAWRLRNYSTWNENNGQREFNNVNTYVQRTIAPLKAELTMGDSYSGADVFDSFQFRGAQIASDDDMLPDSMKNFAPVIRGIAKTNAQVTIKQNGYTVYQSYVTPGAFEINDLYPSSDSGDLTITIKEQDGSEQTYIQPYASVPILQREGRLKFSATAGQYRNGYGSEKPEFGQFTLIRGFSKGLTVYGGMQGTQKYASAALGIGKNMGDLGAISLDVTQARTQLPEDETSTGQSYRFLYAKTFAETDTDFRLVGYRYSTSGYYSLDDSVTLNDDNTDTTDFNIRTHKRSRIEGSISQQLGETGGSLYFSGSLQDYWDSSDKEQTVQAGYSNTWNSISYNIAYSDNYVGDENHDRQISLNISVPLDHWLKAASATYSVSHDSNGRVQNQAGISGTLLEDKNLSYSVSEGYANQGQGASGNTSLNYQGQYGSSNIGYSYSKDSHRVNYGIQGGVIAHSHGITLSQPLGDTVALIEAPGADNARVVNNTGVKTDFRGYAVVPFLTPYRRTSVSLDTTTLGDKVELENSAKDVIPTRGAIVRTSFNAHVGYRVMMTLKRPDGRPLPFGTTVALLTEAAEGEKSNDSINTGIVGEQGETFLSGLPEKGQLMAQWGNSPDQQCQVSYQLTQQQIAMPIPTLAAICKIK